jgi:SAM-dependent methyltransferase
MSWDEAFAELYDEWSAEMTADVDFYLGLARSANGPIVELAVGNGRVAIPVAQAIGRPVIGIDTSPAMLEQARVRAAEVGVELDLREGDMRDLVLDQPAALVYCPFRALLHLPSWADRRSTFERVTSSLLPGGASPGTPSPSITRSPPASMASIRTSQSRTRSGTRLATTGWTSRSTTAREAHSGGQLKDEWLGLLDVAGLQLEALHGGFAGESFDDESREYVFVARRS